MVTYPAPGLFKVTNVASCSPRLSITLTWQAVEDEFSPIRSSRTTSDIDLHVYEPDGTHVFWDNKEGGFSALDNDDVDGTGPENVIVSPAAFGTFQFEARLYDLNSDSAIVFLLQVRRDGRLIAEYSDTLAEGNDISLAYSVELPELTNRRLDELILF